MPTELSRIGILVVANSATVNSILVRVPNFYRLILRLNQQMTIALKVLLYCAGINGIACVLEIFQKFRIFIMLHFIRTQ